MRMATISEPHPFYERLFMRVSFAWVVLLSHSFEPEYSVALRA